MGARSDVALLKVLPLNQLFVESDDSGDVESVYELISGVKQVEIAELKACVASNIYNLLVECRVK